MNDLTNSKIAALVPQWKAFPGISLLFDNPGHNVSLANKAENQTFRKIESSPDIAFYHEMHRCLNKQISQLPMNDYLLCKLPYESYHITVNDLANKENLDDLKPASKAYFSSIFEAFPQSLPQCWECIPFLADSVLIKRKDWHIRFRFDHLRIWGDNVLVARLNPADESSKLVFEELERLRKAANDNFQALHGYSRSIKEDFSVHLTLAYFGNQLYARQIAPFLAAWDCYFSTAMKSQTSQPLKIELNSISLYGFTDMATFFCVH